jgi:phosphate transport system substrate-binding protein
MNHTSSINMTRALLGALLVFPLGASLLAADDKLTATVKPGATAEPANAGVSIWTQNVTGFRKEHGVVGGYKKRWDLSEMPHYAPKQQLTGTLRIWGNNYIKDGDLAQYWLEEFKKFQPGITIEYHLPTATIAVPALACGAADLGLCYKARLTDLLVFEQMFHHPITEITAFTGSYDVYGWSPATIIAVNKDNPLTQISMKQLDRVFGGARTGGYVGSVWHTEYPYSRGADENIRTWDQLGLTGEWVGKPIHIGGQNLTAGASYSFNVDVLRGSYQFAENYQAFTNYITPDGKINSWSLQARRAIAKDKYAMFYVSPASMGPELKELAVQAYEGGPYVARSVESIHNRTYPLYHENFFYLNRDPGKPIDPKVEEFLRFILSQEGQDCIQREGRYMPLLPGIVKEQLKKLE